MMNHRQENPLSGKAALVTGAGSGLGQATAHALARAGCMVACCDINDDAASRVSQELSQIRRARHLDRL